VDSIAITKARGKGPPKKKRTAEGVFCAVLVVWIVWSGVVFRGVFFLGSIGLLLTFCVPESKKFAKRKPVAKAAP